MKIRMCLALLLLALPLSAGAQSITLIMIQQDEAATQVFDITRRLESAIMDSFFDNGFIISNEPVVVTSGGTDLYTERLGDAIQGNIGYVVPVKLVYPTGAARPDRDTPIAAASSILVSWEIIDSKNCATAAKGSATCESLINAPSARDLERGVRRFSAQLVAEIGTTVKKL